MKRMKKIMMIFLIGITSISLIGCTKKLEGYDEITIDELKEMVANKQDLILFIGSDECSHCSTYKITVNKIVQNYQVDIKYINIANLSESERNDLLEISNFGNSTPTTVFIKEGKEYCGETNNCSYYRIIGDQDYDKLLKKLQDKGYIK